MKTETRKKMSKAKQGKPSNNLGKSLLDSHTSILNGRMYHSPLPSMIQIYRSPMLNNRNRTVKCSISHLANVLGVDRQVVYRYLDRYGIDLDSM